jgi:glyoxylase-like metal-dependent hydrolase (beta-lactamase superfamily II)
MRRCRDQRQSVSVSGTAFSLAVAAATIIASSELSTQGIPQVKTQAPGFFRLMLGDYEITAVSDGTLPVPLDTVLTNTKPGQVEAFVARTYQTLPLETSINSFLINTGLKLILVDAGAGRVLGPTQGGRLVSNLRAAGYQPEQIDTVLLTHLHGDHSGGLVVDGKMIFPNALVHVHQREKDFWLSDAEASNAPAGQKPAFVQAHDSLTPYIDAGKLRTFDGAAQLFPGVTTIPTPGHTPGHTFYSVESKGQKLVFWGDVIHAAEVQFPDPTVTIKYDRDFRAAAAQRATAFAEAAKGGYWVAAPHISFPGVGHLRSEGTGYVWMPAPYRPGPF